MQYLISFIEGILTFISPCLLPMLPVYISYFAGGEASSKKTMKNALGFILGFTILFTAMGALAGTLGSFLSKYQTAVNIVMLNFQLKDWDGVLETVDAALKDTFSTRDLYLL